MDNTSESIMALKPVMFYYTGDNTSTPQFGLIAEDVVEVNPELTVRDKTGELVTVHYDAVNAMLLNLRLKRWRTTSRRNFCARIRRCFAIPRIIPMCGEQSRRPRRTELLYPILPKRF